MKIFLKVLAVLLALTGPARAAGYFPGAVIGPHGHTGPTDGGRLTNLNLLGGTFSVATSTLITSGGKVGISTGTPRARLDVNGDSIFRGATTFTSSVTYLTTGVGKVVIGEWGLTNAYAGIGLGGSLAAGQLHVFSTPGGNLYINTISGGNINFRENDVDRGGWNTGGNFGVGTVGATEKLQVVGGNIESDSGFGYGTSSMINVKQEYIKAVSIDGTTESSGCVVVVTMTSPTNPSATAQFTSTNTALLSLATAQGIPGVLLETCAPGATCKVGLRGVYRSVSRTTFNTSFIGFSSTRCGIEGQGALDSAMIGYSMSGSAGQTAGQAGWWYLSQ